jgi:hypothetical protein
VAVPPRLCLITEPERHGLACDVPLPPPLRTNTQSR